MTAIFVNKYMDISVLFVSLENPEVDSTHRCKHIPMKNREEFSPHRHKSELRSDHEHQLKTIMK